MDNDRQEDIINKFKYLEKKNIEDKIKLKVIDKELKQQFSCDTLDQANKKLKEVEEDIESFKSKSDTLMEKIEKVTDWDKIDIFEED